MSKIVTTQPVIELMSLAAGGGKTHILYHLSALAMLPHALGGKQECVVIIDADGRFSIPRLAAQVKLLLQRHRATDPPENSSDEKLNAETLAALKHVHIFQPQSLAATITTLDSLPDYLFNQNRHYSFDREVAFVALDSASAFYWQDRSKTENATFLAKTTAAAGSQISTLFQLAKVLKQASTTLDCPVVFTSWYLGPQLRSTPGTIPKSFRPQLPPLPASLRLVVHRVPVPKFPTSLGLDGALRDAADRQKVVAEGRFECFINEWAAEDRPVLRKTRDSFGFRILGDGLVVDETLETGDEQHQGG